MCAGVCAGACVQHTVRKTACQLARACVCLCVLYAEVWCTCVYVLVIRKFCIVWEGERGEIERGHAAASANT